MGVGAVGLEVGLGGLAGLGVALDGLGAVLAGLGGVLDGVFDLDVGLTAGSDSGVVGIVGVAAGVGLTAGVVVTLAGGRAAAGVGVVLAGLGLAGGGVGADSGLVFLGVGSAGFGRVLGLLLISCSICPSCLFLLTAGGYSTSPPASIVLMTPHKSDTVP